MPKILKVKISIKKVDNKVFKNRNLCVLNLFSFEQIKMSIIHVTNVDKSVLLRRGRYYLNNDKKLLLV